MNKLLKTILRIIALLLTLPILSFCLSGCAGGTLKEYKPEFPEQEAVKATLIAFEDAWNKHDESKVLNLLHKDFVVWARGRRNIIFSKNTFAFNLRDMMRKYRYLSIGKPAVWLKSHKATVHVPISVDGRLSKSIFGLIRERNDWLLLEWEF